MMWTAGFDDVSPHAHFSVRSNEGYSVRMSSTMPVPALSLGSRYRDGGGSRYATVQVAEDRSPVRSEGTAAT
jgi:hypothetical protein